MLLPSDVPAPPLHMSFKIALQPENLPDSRPIQPKKRKTAAELLKANRQIIKNDEKWYKLHREYETTRVKLYMAQILEEKKAACREVTVHCVRRWRAEQKASGNLVGTYVVPKTRKAKESTRAKYDKNQGPLVSTLSCNLCHFFTKTSH